MLWAFGIDEWSASVSACGNGQGSEQQAAGPLPGGVAVGRVPLQESSMFVNGWNVSNAGVNVKALNSKLKGLRLEVSLWVGSLSFRFSCSD